MRLLHLLPVLVFAAAAHPATTGPDATKRDFPAWSILKQAGGDLNGDNAADFAAILVRPGEVDPEALLVVYLTSGSGLHLVTQAPKAICVGCGGIRAAMGQPLGELEISKGILTTSYRGGSRAEWSDVCRWQWNASARQFLLIGETYKSVDILGQDPAMTLEIDYSTLKMVGTFGSSSNTCTLPAKLKGLTLATFDFQAHDVSTLPDLCAP